MTTVDVCVCTFRRDSLEAALESVKGQAPAGTVMRVIVADNDEEPTKRAAVEKMGAQLGLDLTYVHAPVRNISVARNACLETATAEWIAFIDDDEAATSNWLAELLRASAHADFVFGVSEALYEQGTPAWMVQADLHSNRMTDRDPVWSGYTSNALMRQAFVRRTRLRFDTNFGATGGEDTLFFFEAHRRGARFAYAPKAVVTEVTQQSRASLRWLLLRRFRSGQTHAEVLRRSGKLASGAMTAGAKAVASLLTAAVQFPRPTAAAKALLRGALHAGVVASAARIGTYREYGGTRRDRAKGKQ